MFFQEQIITSWKRKCCIKRRGILGLCFSPRPLAKSSWKVCRLCGCQRYYPNLRGTWLHNTQVLHRTHQLPHTHKITSWPKEACVFRASSRLWGLHLTVWRSPWECLLGGDLPRLRRTVSHEWFVSEIPGMTKHCSEYAKNSVTRALL